MRTSLEIIEWRARTAPDRPALTDDHGAALTYDELVAAVGEVAGGWVRLGVRPGDAVAVLARNSVDYIVHVLGLNRIGAIPVLLNWRLSAIEIAQLLGLAGPVAVLADPAFTQLVPDDFRGVRRAIRPDGSAWEAFVVGAVPTESFAHDPQRPFVLIHTSGTTGLPKLIPLTSRSQVSSSLAFHLRAPRLGGGRRHLRFAPLFHLSGLGSIMLALVVGDQAHILSAFDAARFVELVAQQRIEFTNLPPAAMRMVLDHVESCDPAPDMSSLVELWYGTAPIDPDVLARAIRLLGCEFRQQYGMSEAQTPISALEAEDHVLGSPRLASAGRILPGWDVRIVDADLDDVAAGAPGELLVRGPALFDGYWNDPARTAEAFHDGWYRTGDIGRLDDDGFLYIVDRAKDMIVSGGENVYPAEVEMIMRDHPDVDEVAVIGVPSERWGETIHAVVVARAGRRVAETEVIEWTRDRLAHFKCPTSVSVADGLPRNATGKVDKPTLRLPFWRDHVRSVG